MYKFLNGYVVSVVICCIVDILIGAMMSFKDGPVKNIANVWNRFNMRGKLVVVLFNIPLISLTLPVLVITTVMFIIGTLIKDISNYCRKKGGTENEEC